MCARGTSLPLTQIMTCGIAAPVTFFLMILKYSIKIQQEIINFENVRRVIFEERPIIAQNV